jgi:hypothetical protein
MYFIFQSTQQFMKGIQMTYLHEDPTISETQYVSTPNESSSGAELIPNLDAYCKVLCFHIEFVTRSS